MNFTLNEDQRMLVDSVRRFANQLRDAAPELDLDGRMDDKLFQQASELGMPLDAVPEGQGGYLEGPYLHLFRALRGLELGAACAGVAHQLESVTDVALALEKAPANVREAWFKRIVDAGYARASILGYNDGFTAEKRDGKLFISGAHPSVLLAETAQVWLLKARGPEGTVLVLFAGKPDGAETFRLSNTGFRACDACDVHLTDIAVADDSVLAAGAEADEIWARVLDTARLSVAARGVGMARAGIDFARRYAGERVQFGRPIAKFQAIAQMLDESAMAVEAARLLVLDTAARFDEGRQISDRIRQVKAHVAKVLTRATIDAVQVLGGYGFVSDYPVEKYYRDARVFETIYGRDILDLLIDQQVPA